MIKNSVDIWAFGPAFTRLVPPGYHNEVADEPMMDKTRRVYEGLSDVLEGLVDAARSTRRTSRRCWAS